MPIPGGYEIREHMADIIVRAWGDSLPELFEQAAEGLYAVIGELAWTPGEAVDVRLTAADADDLLHDYLAELLFIFETQHAVLAQRRSLLLSETQLHVAAQRCPLDWERCTFHREVKAVTYHGLQVERRDPGHAAPAEGGSVAERPGSQGEPQRVQGDGGYAAEIILDI
ncbi:MAG TPA: archease [Phycisphaerae bacterium]|jgi:SHS2 domain-containing protein